VRFIEERGLNEFFGDDGASDLGIIVQGGNYNALLRALERLGLADAYGRSQIPLYVMNVTYPVVPSEITRFCAGKRAVLLVEEGSPTSSSRTSRRCCARPTCRPPCTARTA
jgi:indolepyruvate ferredoxin oxidoreductase alpha subunit